MVLTPSDPSHAPISSICLYEAASVVAYGRRKSVVVLFTVMLSPPTGTGPRLKNQSRMRPPPDSGCENVTACASSHRHLAASPNLARSPATASSAACLSDVVARFGDVRRGTIVEPGRSRIADDGVKTGEPLVAGVPIETIVERCGHVVGERPPPERLLERFVDERHGPLVDAAIPRAKLLHRIRHLDRLQNEIGRQAGDVGVNLPHRGDIETAPVAEQFGDALRPERRDPIARHEVRQTAIDFVVRGHDLARRRIEHSRKLIRCRPIRANPRRAARREPAACRPNRREPAAVPTSRNRCCRRHRHRRSSARAPKIDEPRRRTQSSSPRAPGRRMRRPRCPRARDAISTRAPSRRAASRGSVRIAGHTPHASHRHCGRDRVAWSAPRRQAARRVR